MDHPIVVGAAQLTNRTRDLADARSPLALMTEAATLALADCGVPALGGKVDSVRVVNILSWPSPDPPADLAAVLGAPPGERLYTGIGGNTPQWLVNRTAEALANGQIRVALLAGAEAMHGLRLTRSRGEQPRWDERGQPAPNTGDARPGFSGDQARHGAHMPAHAYPLFENAIRAQHGWTLAEHRRRIGRIGAALSEVAAANCRSWFPIVRTAEEIMSVSPSNRMVAFPYPKYLNAIIEVDQAAAIVLTTESHALELGIPRERWVYLHGCGDANDHWSVLERASFADSPALRRCARSALSMAGASIEQMNYIDIYSCFPSAVQIGREALGVAEDDTRPLTVTGGLPYFGGPGNNYQMHAIATLTEILRERPASLGITTGLGWFETKHSVGIYGAARPAREWQHPDPATDQAVLDALPRCPLTEAPDGAASIETYTVVYGRDGAPQRSIIIGKLDDGVRFFANGPTDDGHVAMLVEREGVGVRGHVRNDTARGINWFDW